MLWFNLIEGDIMLETIIKEMFNILNLGKAIASMVLAFVLIAFFYPYIAPLEQNELLFCYFGSVLVLYGIITYFLGYTNVAKELEDHEKD
jgi:uncharacterized protein YhhL (DUF1145 family)